MNRERRCARLREADLYVVITGEFCAGRSSLDVLGQCLDAGVRLVQLREKDLSDAELYGLALQWRSATRERDTLFIVDDRVDIALAVGADGVHLGATDLPVATARGIAPELLIGASSHCREEALAAQAVGADYVNIGPIFPTQTKSVPTGVVGPEMISHIAPALTIPWTCMGGIKEHNIDVVLERGARIVAVVTAVTAAPDCAAAAAALIGRMGDRKRN